jgi:hypothetical protein
VSLLLLENELLVGLAVGASVTSSWKIVKRLELSLRGSCVVVVELAVSRVEEKLTIRRDPKLRGGLGEEGEPSWH